ncbi:unnamed protein product, partial [Prorocentrum cordatum]
ACLRRNRLAPRGRRRERLRREVPAGAARWALAGRCVQAPSLGASSPPALRGAGAAARHRRACVAVAGRVGHAVLPAPGRLRATEVGDLRRCAAVGRARPLGIHQNSNADQSTAV